MRERKHKYIPGDHLMVCDECGSVFRYSEMKKRYDNAWVCKNDWEPKHPQESVRGRADRVRVQAARPEPEEVMIETAVTQDDL